MAELLTEWQVAAHLNRVEKIRMRAKRIADIRSAKRAAEAQARWEVENAARLAAMTPGQLIVEKYIDAIAWGDRNNNISFTEDLARDIDAAIKGGGH